MRVNNRLSIFTVSLPPSVFFFLIEVWFPNEMQTSLRIQLAELPNTHTRDETGEDPRLLSLVHT